jgi:hypothetical protein
MRSWFIVLSIHYEIIVTEQLYFSVFLDLSPYHYVGVHILLRVHPRRHTYKNDGFRSHFASKNYVL